MLNCGDLTRVNRLWANNRDVSREKCRDDALMQELINTKASPTSNFILGESCDDVDEIALQVDLKELKRHASKKPEKRSVAPTRVVRHASISKEKENPSPFKFTKETIPQSTPAAKSLLNVSDMTSMLKRMEVTVYAREEKHTTDSPVIKLKVAVHEDATVLDVVQEALKALEKQKVTALGDSPFAVVLHVAEEDGRPDDDLPALSVDQPIRKLGKVFCMMPRVRARRPSAREPTKIVKIMLPGNEHKVVAFRPELKMKELLLQICTRWNLDSTEHVFRLGETSAVDVDGDITMRDLDTHTNGKNNLVLIKTEKKSEEAIVTPHLFKDKLTVISYKQYEVWKIKSKFSKKQERLLGVSGEMITNDNSRKRGATTKRPMRLIREVKEVFISDKKSTQFFLKYLKEAKPYLYEAKTPEIAREIVDKIQSCMHYANATQQ